MSGMANAVGVLVVAAMFLTGCASQQPPGSSQRNYNRDLYECEREATFAGRDNKQQVFDSCMKARGYTLFSTDRPEWPHTQ
jgi:PBP1b-binding outer membrane lipoprotein LpoB